MEFLNRLVRPDYQNAAWDIREYAIAMEVRPQDRQFADGIHLQLHQFVAERTFLRTGLCCSYLNVLCHDQPPNSTSGVAMTNYVLSRAMEEHFTRLPGIDAELGRRILQEALGKYYVREVEPLTATFLSSLTGREIDIESVKELPSIIAFVSSEFRECLLLIQKKVARLRPSNS